MDSNENGQSKGHDGIQEDTILSDINETFSSKEDLEIQTENFLRFYKLIDEYGKNYQFLAAFEKFRELIGLFNITDQLVDPDYGKIFFELPNVKRILEINKLSSDPILQILERTKEVLATIHYQDADEWLLGADMFGIKTWYRYNEDNTVTLKLVGACEELPVFELFSVIKEVDLFKEWVPFCKESSLIDEITHQEQVAYMWLYSPMLGRDLSFHGYAADCMKEHGSLIIIGKPVDDYPNKTIPWKPKSWTHDRLILKEFKATINILGPNQAKTTFIVHIVPRTSLPQSMINYLLKNVAGVMLYWFQQQTLKVAKDHNCSHAHRIRDRTHFYRDWLLPKVRAFCDEHGWEQPTIACLGPDGIPPAPGSVPPSKEGDV